MHTHHGDGLPLWLRAVGGVLLVLLVLFHSRNAWRLYRRGRPERAINEGVQAGMGVGMISMVVTWTQPVLLGAGWTVAFAGAGGVSLGLLVGWPELTARPRGREFVGAAAMAYMLNPAGAPRAVDVCLAVWFAGSAGFAGYRALIRPGGRLSMARRTAEAGHLVMAALMSAMFAVPRG